MSYSLEINCEGCGAQLGCDIEPGSLMTAPECDACEKAVEQVEWPDKATLLAVYGAPFNWPVAA